jgi:hypothetical protein
VEYPSAHKGSYRRREQPEKSGKRRGPRRTKAQIDKDHQALDLHCQGKNNREIAEIIGWKSPSTATIAVQRALRDKRCGGLDAVDNFALAVERIQQDIAEQQKIIDTPHYVVSTTGKVVEDPDTGLPMLDDAPKARALDAKLKLYDQLNKLQGNYAPAKVRQEVITQDAVDLQIQAELEQIRKLAADAGDAPGTGIPREP